MVGPRQAGEMVKARAIDGPVSRWWGLPGCNGTNQPVTTPCGRRAPRRSVAPLPPTPSGSGCARGAGRETKWSSGQRAIGVGGPAGPVGSARQHVTSPHTHDARDPRASSRPGPSLSPQSLGVQLSFFHFNKKNQLIHLPHPIQFRCGLCTYKG